MRWNLMSTLSAMVLVLSCIPFAEAAGPGGTTVAKKKYVSVTVTTTTNSANFDFRNNPDTAQVTGSLTATVITTTTTAFGHTFTSTQRSLSGNVQNVPTVDNNLVVFGLNFGGVAPATPVASTVIASGAGSFNISTTRGDAVPTVTAGDVMDANASIGGQPVTLKKAIFAGPVTTVTQY
ncbi:MAG: hypothetical protein ACKV0T_18350 [Planctomycetales bacterium]